MKVGTTHAAIVGSKKDINGFLDSLGIRQTPEVIIKPNWVDPNTGTHTDAKILDLLFRSFTGKITVVESHTTWRNEKYLKGNDWPRQPIPPAEGSLENVGKHIDWIREQERWFLDHTGIGRTMVKNGVDYVNVTEEVMAGRTGVVSAKVKNKNLLNLVPKKLLELKGSVFISLGKVKTDGNNVVTLSTKNLFGMIPDPSRWPKYHGYKDKKLCNNIIDMNNIYRSLFNLYYINEGVYTALEGPWPMEINPVKNWGRIMGGKNCIEVDSLTAYMMGVENVDEIPLLNKASMHFGKFDLNLLKSVPDELIKPLQFW
jgi:hypothetical protein